MTSKTEEKEKVKLSDAPANSLTAVFFRNKQPRPEHTHHEDFVKALAAGSISRMEFVQHATQGGAYIRCFYVVNEKVYQVVPSDAPIVFRGDGTLADGTHVAWNKTFVRHDYFYCVVFVRKP
jgi:hypothetical protein